MQEKWSLERQRTAFINRKFLAVPVAGLLVWLLVGISGIVFPDKVTVWVLFIGTGSISYLGMFFSKWTGENLMSKKYPVNEFDTLFLFSMLQSMLVFALTIPFFMTDYTSLPLSLGILTCLMWIPFSWIIQHWVGWFHALSRTGTVLILWYFFPEDRFITIPFAIVLIYIITLVILHFRESTKN
jgi:hypothetical protein